MLKNFTLFNQSLNSLKIEKTLFCTLNAHCYNLTKIDPYYLEALENSNVLLPDGVSIIWAIKLLTGQRLRKIAGADLFFHELERLNRSKGKCFFLGSTTSTLSKIKKRLSIEYPNIEIELYSPPFKVEFSAEDNMAMTQSINNFHPDTLMIGMTAPKQEKWAYQNFNQIQAYHICCIGAVFDFYAGTITRAPQWMINIGLEWLYRLIKEPRRMWKRYLIGNIKFIWYILSEKLRI
jgi:N-acetylglucosaminyldiphosphoundecaprenol N-acetyl-beta-D-mannosaminyltransferase